MASKETVDALIKAGADVNAQENRGKTPLHYALEGSNPLIAAALVRAGADMHIADKEGITPAQMLAERHGKNSIMALYVRRAMKEAKKAAKKAAKK